MKERPILMRGPLVVATIEDRKTQTRRVIRPQPDIIDCDGNARRYKPLEVVLNGELVVMHGPPDDSRGARYVDRPIVCPYGGVSDRLWVRETWCACDGDDGRSVAFRADDWAECPADDGRWRPAIHMPRWASRLTLEITDIQVERVRDITEADCIAEGVSPDGRAGVDPHKYAFKHLWNDMNAKRGFGWDVDPWVWAITYRRVV